MSDRNIEGFILTEAIVVCPECQAPFIKDILVETPTVKIHDIIEADLHRVFPDSAIRAALLAYCPDCKYCFWTSNFRGHTMNPFLLKKEGEIEHSKKFALAVNCARAKKLHSLDIAFIALNGLWCARESGEQAKPWLELALYEHHKGLQETPAHPEQDGLRHLMMAELLRQTGRFEAAIEEYKLAELDSTIIKDIINHQITLCQRKQSMATALPAYIVEQLYTIEQEVVPQEEDEEDFPVLPVANKAVISTSSNTPSTLSKLAYLKAQDKPKIADSMIMPSSLFGEIKEPAYKQLIPSNKNALPEINIEYSAPVELAGPEMEIAQEAANDYSDAISRVENYLSLSRQHNQKSRIKGYS